VIEFLSEFFGFLLDKGELVAAVAVVLVGATAMYLRRGNASPAPSVSAQTRSQSQTTVISDVRSDGDVNVAPRQDNG